MIIFIHILIRILRIPIKEIKLLIIKRKTRRKNFAHIIIIKVVSMCFFPASQTLITIGSYMAGYGWQLRRIDQRRSIFLLIL